jgi:hypothetical protein
MTEMVFPAKVEAAAREFLVARGVPDHVMRRLVIVPTVVSPITVYIGMHGQDGWQRVELFRTFPSQHLVNEILLLA